jgi:hypothetical protein
MANNQLNDPAMKLQAQVPVGFVMPARECAASHQVR